MNFQKTIVAVGSFDGVHCGHGLLLHRMNELAKKNKLMSVVLTFWPHPRRILDMEGNAPLLLNTLEERITLIKQYGVENVEVLHFDTSLAKVSAVDFINEIVIKKLNAQRLIFGQDHHFGRERSGDAQNLPALAGKNNLQVDVVSLKMLDKKISSSAIRKSLLSGDLDFANEMLGYSYNISGKIITGNRLGRTIGFPTANVATPSYKLIPKEGVYRVKVKIGNSNFEHTGMMYVGKRTVLKQEDSDVQVEVNIFDFDKQIYGQEITLALTHRIRDKMKFDDINLLSQQLQRDKEKVMNVH